MIRTVLALMVAASLVAVAGFLLLARDIYVVETGSMTPTLRPGDAVVVKSLDGPVHPGQVITFEMQGKLITHRVTRVDGDGIHVKGDALDEEDPWTIPPAAVRGEMDFRIPYAGYLVVFLRQPAGWLSLVVLPALLVFGTEVRSVVRRRRRAREANAPVAAEHPSALMRRAALLAAFLTALAVLASLAAALCGGSVLGFFSGTKDESLVITTAPFGSIPATVEIDPETLNLKSHGQWVAAYVELPQGYDVGNIDVSTVRLCLGQVSACPEDAFVPAQEHPCDVGDHDGDTIPDLMVKFSRQEVIELLGGQTGDVTMTVAGVVSPPGEPFAGSDTIRVVDGGCGGADIGTCVEEEKPLQDPPPTPEADPATPEAPLATPDAPPPAPAVPTSEYQVHSGDTQVPGTAPTAAPSAPPASPAPPPSAVATVEYTVRPGERLSDVATFFGTTVDAIVALNGLTDPNLVMAGQRLIVPAPPANTAPGRVFMSEYVVQPGETLTDIAARFGTTVEALAAENSLANPSAIRIGDRLRVP